MEKLKTKALNGPIPGENYFSDTKNYAWHRPPEIKDLNKGIEEVFTRVLNRKRSKKFLTAMEMGVPITSLVDIFLTMGISQGKWTPDFAILLAGPTAHILKIMAEHAGIEYVMGLEGEQFEPTSSYYKNLNELSDTALTEAINDVKSKKDEIVENTLKSNNGIGGFVD
jgi:hypothetical protein